MQPIPILLFVFILGLLLGSFLNVCIYRIPLGRTVVKGRSYCPECGNLIPWYRNIPLFSYLLLQGRCKDCDTAISPVYPIVELLNALLYVLVFAIYGLTIPALLLAILSSLLIVISFIDLRWKIIPDCLVLFMFGLGIVHGVYQIVVLNGPWHLHGIGFFAAALPLWALGYAFKDGVGGGDIKFMAAAGLFAGWKLILLSLYLGALFGLVYSGVLFFMGKAGRRTEIPFGPFLSLGLLTSLLIGDSLMQWYSALF